MEWLPVIYTAAVAIPALNHLMTIRDTYNMIHEYWYDKKKKVRIVTVMESEQDDYVEVELQITDVYEDI